MSTSGEPRGSVVINDRLYILMTHNPGTGNQLYLFELNTSNGAVVWQNTIKPNTGFTMGYTNNALQEDKDGKLAVQFKLGDSGSAITGNGIVFARGIDVNGGRGGGVVGTELLYQSTTDISMSSYTASSSSSNLSTGSFSVGSINDYSGTNIQNNNVDQTMTNVNNI